MIIEVDAQDVDLATLEGMLKGLELDPRPILIKNALSLYDQEQWYRYLEEQCSFLSDSRHFSGTDWKMGDSYSIESQKWWEVSYQPDKATSYAFSKTPQPLHNDNAFFQDGADLNFNLMIKQAENGGENTIYFLSDLIDDLREKDPRLLKRLLETTVVIKKGDGPEKNVTNILIDSVPPTSNWNYYRTLKDDSEVEALCEQFFVFLGEQEKTGRVRRVRLESGDGLVWNDKYILHGRTGFDADEAFDRVFRQSTWRFQGSV